MRGISRAAFDRLFLDFLAERERRMGSAASGLETFYLRRLHLGRAFQPSEEAAIALILDQLPSYRFYVEIGAGLGQLSCWLGASGLQVLAIERNDARFAGLADFCALLGERWPDTHGQIVPIHDTFPCPLPGEAPGDTLILAANLVHGATFAQEQAIIDGIGRFAAALIDSVRFCNDRVEPAEWEALDLRFAAAGLPLRREVWKSRSTGSPERLVWYRRAAP